MHPIRATKAQALRYALEQSGRNRMAIESQDAEETAHALSPGKSTNSVSNAA
jgi:hypothetical protein